MSGDILDSEFSSLADVLDVGIVVLDEGQQIVGWNDWIASASHQPKQAVLGKLLYDVFPHLRDTRLPAAIDDSLAVGSSSILTHSLNQLLPLVGEGGQELVHNIVVRPFASGQQNRCLLQITDVSVSVSRERVLRERQNARYHAIVDTAPDAIITTNLDGAIQWMNGAAEHVFGYAPAELLGRTFDLLLDSDNIARAFAAERAGVWEGRVQVVARRKRGALGHFDVSFARWKADGRSFITTIWRDVTERMAAEVALREIERHQRALLEALPQLVWTCGPDGGCDYFNPQWEGYTGEPAEKHLGSGWLKVIHDADREAIAVAWSTAVAQGAPFDVEGRLRRADGSHRWFNMRSIPVRAPDGKVTRWFGTASDITDLVEARESLRRSNEELEARVAERTREREIVLSQLHESQKMESIGQLTGGVAHDFNNLLAVILGSLELLRKRFPDDPQTARLLDGAIRGAERGATLTRRLLAFSRRQELKLEAVEVRQLVPEMLDFLRRAVGPSILIHVDILPEVQPIKIDANQFEMALINLVVNARDAMPNGGALTISCRDETVTAASDLPNPLPPGEYVRISVADTGEGMDEATLAQAALPFFTTKGIGKGTGLGLSMVHGLIAQSGGTMHISSKLNKGTAVTLWLPRARPEDVPRATAYLSPLATEMSGRRLKILLVDDDPLVSMNTADMLMDLGHTVSEASSAAHALRLLEDDPEFDVVITDYAMPGMNGLDLATSVKRMKPDLPVVLATGYAELPPHPARGFPRLEKPYSQGEIARTLERVLYAAKSDDLGSAS